MRSLLAKPCVSCLCLFKFFAKYQNILFSQITLNVVAQEAFSQRVVLNFDKFSYTE